MAPGGSGGPYGKFRQPTMPGSGGYHCAWGDSSHAGKGGAAIALTNFAHQPYNRTAVVKSGAMQPLLEQLSSPSAGVAYHAAQALMAMQ